MSVQMRNLIHFATLAANGHNTQPWHFAIEDDTVKVYPDYDRQLEVVDPHHRELWISLGCALENLVIAARASAYDAEITYPAPDVDYLRVRLHPTNARSAASNHQLVAAIPNRQNTRSEYDGQPVPATDLAQIEALPSESGISTLLLTGRSQIESVIEYIGSGDLKQYGDQAFIDELVTWLRFNKREAVKTLDGLYTACAGYPNVPRWLGKRLVNTSSAERQAQTDERNVRSSAGVIVIVSDQDEKRAWVDTGRVYERLALTLTTLDIKSAFLNQPIEVAELRSEFQSYLGLDSAQPQLLLRFGYSEPMPRSLRRPVEEVLLK